MSGKIFYVMGKSASGKDTIYKRLRQSLPQMGTVVMYTTRPMRDGEENGREYHFTDREFLERVKKEGRLIECRTYETVCGPWDYFTVDDGQIELESGSYLMMGTLESYRKMREYYGAEVLVPIYIQVEDGLREYMRRVVCRMGEAEFARMLASCRAWDEAMRAELPAQDGAVPAPCPCGQTQQSQKEETASC